MGGERARAVSSYPKLAERPVGKKIHRIYEDRLRMFTQGGQYAENSLLAKLYKGRVSGEPSVKLSVYSPPNLERPTFKEATSHEFRSTQVGESFGPSWATHWFKIHFTVPKELRKHTYLEFHWDANNEGLVWSEDGVPLQGLTGGGERVEWIIPESYRDGKEHIIYIEMACNAMFGNPPGGDIIQPPAKDKYYKLQEADIVAVNMDARQLYIDFWIIGDAAREFSGDSWEEHKALDIGNKIMDCFIAGDGSDESIKQCRKIAQGYLGDKVDTEKVYESGLQPLVFGIGHCHIDSCWLWPWAETKRKVARSWSNQCNLIDRYPEHRFVCSQAQQYKWLEQDYPALYDRVKKKVKEGKFQPIGGSWVEHDTNMPSGESLVRQFLYGQRYFESHFGERSTTFWLPDTFGYSSQLPQLCRLAGMTRFFTQKLSWNNINKFPHTTFNWIALDGSQVLCHMCPAETYTAEAHFGDVNRSVTQHKSMDQDPSSLLVFGKGDGGGGPTWEHLEKLRRCRGLSDKTGKLPRVSMGGSVDEFFARLEKLAEHGTEFVTWYGELYFELHRGTYTTQANNKRNNRRAEVMLHDLEWLATLASIQDTTVQKSKSYKYPKSELDEMWEAVLLCQFHDCLPGSSIEMCYDDSDELYAKVFKTGEKLIEKTLTALGFTDPSLTSLTEGKLVAINTLPWERTDAVRLPSVDGLPTYGFRSEGIALASLGPCQRSNGVPRVSCTKLSKDEYKIRNDQLEVTVCSGVITSLYDKIAARELIPSAAKANQLVLFDDKPLYWQAWDVEVYHLESRKELQPSKTYVSEDGPECVSLVTETAISERSWIKTTISLKATDQEPTERSVSYVEMSSEVEWREDKKFLKVEFPVDIHSTEASYETQYGIARRPTHYNTTWDMAKFEVCCHKWADLSEAGYGVSILNDSKYGFATQGNVMRLSLLRAPKAPDAHADMGRHHIRYAIMPHQGPLDHRTIRAGYQFNHPISAAPSEPHSGLFPFTSPALHSYVRTHADHKSIAPLLGAVRMLPGSNPAIILDAIKRGEDDHDVVSGTPSSPSKSASGSSKRKDRSIIIRLYDSLGGKCRGKVSFGRLPVRKVYTCNLLEDDGELVKTHVARDETGAEDGEGFFDIELRAFEVVTYRLVL